jgi:polyisoprenyl-phosphate glycosyltransferase
VQRSKATRESYLIRPQELKGARVNAPISSYKDLVISKDVLISIVITIDHESPVAQNRSAEIEHLTENIIQTLRPRYRNFEIIYVCDGHRADVYPGIQKLLSKFKNTRLLTLSRRSGRQIALSAGIEHAIGDFVVLVPFSFEGVAEIIPELVVQAQKGFDIVYLTWSGDAKGDSLLYRCLSAGFYRLNRHLTGIHFDRRATDFLVLSRRVVNAISQLKEHHRFLRMLLNYMGFKVTSITIDQPRPLTSRVDRRRLGLALDSLISFSARPLRYVSVLSLSISLLSLIGGLITFFDHFISDHVVEGWTSLMLVLLIMFWMLFLVLAVIAEYVHRILLETKNRPCITCMRTRVVLSLTSKTSSRSASCPLSERHAQLSGWSA